MHAVMGSWDHGIMAPRHHDLACTALLAESLSGEETGARESLSWFAPQAPPAGILWWALVGRKLGGRDAIWGRPHPLNPKSGDTRCVETRMRHDRWGLSVGAVEDFGRSRSSSFTASVVKMK